MCIKKKFCLALCSVIILLGSRKFITHFRPIELPQKLLPRFFFLCSCYSAMEWKHAFCRRYKDNVTWQKVKKTVDPVSKQKRDYKARKDWTMFDLYNRTGHTLKGMLKVCRYRGETCNSTRWKTVSMDSQADGYCLLLKQVHYFKTMKYFFVNRVSVFKTWQ